MPQPPVPAPRTRIEVHRHFEPIFAAYLTIQKAHLQALERALTAGDLATLHRLGHTIKGGAATYELPPAAVLGARLEEAASHGNLESAAALVAALHDFFARLDVTFVD